MEVPLTGWKPDKEEIEKHKHYCVRGGYPEKSLQIESHVFTVRETGNKATKQTEYRLVEEFSETFKQTQPFFYCKKC